MLLATGCLDSRCLDGGAIRDLLAQLELPGVVLVTREGAVPSRLAGLPARAVRSPVGDVAQGVEIARAAGSRRLVIDLSSDDELDQLAPRLHGLARGLPGLELAVGASASGPFSEPETLELLLDDLAALGLGYWHRPARVAALGADEVSWLDRLGSRLVGASLDDRAGEETGLPPGLGEIDFARTARLLGRAPDVALDTDPLPEPSLLGAAVAHLRASGFP